MGRKKLAYKKIESDMSRRTTFCKRRYGLVKKAHEISILCDLDVVVIGFSEAGKLFQYCNQENMEDVVTRISDVPPSDRTGQTYEAWKGIRQYAQQIKEKRNLESPTPVPNAGSEVAYFDLHCENRGLKETINKMKEEKTFWEQKERVYSGEAGIETITSINHLATIEEEFNECLRRLFGRANELKAQSSNPSHGSFGMASVGPAQDDQKFFTSRALMGQPSYQEHNQPDSMGHQGARTVENNYYSMMCGKGVQNFNLGAQTAENNYYSMMSAKGLQNLNSGARSAENNSYSMMCGRGVQNLNSGARTAENNYYSMMCGRSVQNLFSSARTAENNNYSMMCGRSVQNFNSGARIAENNNYSIMYGKGVQNLNPGTARIGETGQDSNSDTNVEFQPGQSAQTFNSGKPQIRETSPNFHKRTKRKSQLLRIGSQNFKRSSNVTTNVKKLHPLPPRPSAQNSSYRELEETRQYEDTGGGRGIVHKQISTSSNQLDRGDPSAPSEQNMPHQSPNHEWPNALSL